MLVYFVHFAENHGRDFAALNFYLVPNASTFPVLRLPKSILEHKSIIVLLFQQIAPKRMKRDFIFLA